MLPFLLLAALLLSVLLLADLAGELRRSETTSRTRWERAMSALSSPAPRRDAGDTGDAATERYDLAA
jgi:hypothetical protein